MYGCIGNAPQRDKRHCPGTSGVRGGSGYPVVSGPGKYQLLSEFCEAVYPCDLNVEGWTSGLRDAGTFDVIVAADVLEHLCYPVATLEALKFLLSRDGGCLVVFLPHVGNNAVVASILDDDFEYRDHGLLDRTHIRFFGLKNMQDLFEVAGYRIVEAEFVITPPGLTELASHWRRLPRKIKSALAGLCHPQDL